MGLPPTASIPKNQIAYIRKQSIVLEEGGTSKIV